MSLLGIELKVSLAVACVTLAIGSLLLADKLGIASSVLFAFMFGCLFNMFVIIPQDTEMAKTIASDYAPHREGREPLVTQFQKGNIDTDAYGKFSSWLMAVRWLFVLGIVFFLIHFLVSSLWLPSFLL